MEMSIIIVAYNSNEVLLPCLRSIHEQNVLGMQLEVIIVDNSPNTRLSYLLQQNAFNFELQYVSNHTNTGFGAGNNKGVQIARSQVLMFLNPDTIVNCDIFTPTLKRIQENNNEVVGYTLTDLDGNPTDSYSFFFEYFWLFPILKLMQKCDFYFVNRIHFANRLCWPWGAAFSVSKTAFCQAGMFDENIFLCNEEPDLMHRMPSRHITILPEQIIHLEGHGRSVSEERYYQSFCSLQYYFKKHKVWSGLYWWMFGLKIQFGHSATNLRRAYQRFRKESKL